jgi:hypothetical protein
MVLRWAFSYSGEALARIWPTGTVRVGLTFGASWADPACSCSLFCMERSRIIRARKPFLITSFSVAYSPATALVLTAFTIWISNVRLNCWVLRKNFEFQSPPLDIAWINAFNMAKFFRNGRVWEECYTQSCWYSGLAVNFRFNAGAPI